MSFSLGEDGYLLDRYQWNPSIAEQLADKTQCVLSEDHWIIIKFLRAFYETYQTMPGQRLIIKHLAENSMHTSVNSIYVHHLFPEGLYRQGALIAGLPKPVRCL